MAEYESMSKAELIEQIRLAEKSRRMLSRIFLLAALAIYVYIFKDELLAVLIKIGAEVKSDG